MAFVCCLPRPAPWGLTPPVFPPVFPHRRDHGWNCGSDPTDGSLQLEWFGDGWVLQHTSDPTGGWSEVSPAATSPYPVATDGCHPNVPPQTTRCRLNCRAEVENSLHSAVHFYCRAGAGRSAPWSPRIAVVPAPFGRMAFTSSARRAIRKPWSALEQTFRWTGPACNAHILRPGFFLSLIGVHLATDLL